MLKKMMTISIMALALGMGAAQLMAGRDNVFEPIRPCEPWEEQKCEDWWPSPLTLCTERSGLLWCRYADGTTHVL